MFKANMKQFFLSAILGVSIVALLSGCGASGSTGDKAAAPTPPATNTATETKVTKENPIAIDKTAKTVKVYAEVNAKYFVEPTRHGVVFKDGSNGDKSFFRAWGNQNDFYDALIEIGAKPGNNLQLTSVGVPVEGDALDVTVTWDGAGKDVTFGEIVVDSTNKDFEPKFGGNEANAESKKTGCILCLDSCPVGITSNSAHPTKDFDNKIASFTANGKVLPADGTPVVVTFKLK